MLVVRIYRKGVYAYLEYFPTPIASSLILWSLIEYTLIQLKENKTKTFFFFWPQGTWDLSSPTGMESASPCNGRVES